jgi:hypothetical protein
MPRQAADQISLELTSFGSASKEGRSGNLDVDHGPAAGRALDGHRPIQRVDAILEADKPRASARGGSADPVVPNREVAATECLQRGRETTLGEDGGVDAARHLAQFVERGGKTVCDAADLRAKLLVARGDLCLGTPQREVERVVGSCAG